MGIPTGDPSHTESQIIVAVDNVMPAGLSRSVLGVHECVCLQFKHIWRELGTRVSLD